MVKNPPCNAGDMGSIPSQGTEIPHTTEQLSPRATPREFALQQKIPRATTRTQPKNPMKCSSRAVETPGRSLASWGYACVGVDAVTRKGSQGWVQGCAMKKVTVVESGWHVQGRNLRLGWGMKGLDGEVAAYPLTSMLGRLGFILGW